MIREVACIALLALRLPRMRGDDPVFDREIGRMIPFAPHARG